MSDETNVPARRESNDESGSSLPTPPGASGGVVEQGLSRFWAILGGKTTDDNRRFVEAQQKYVRAFGELADTAYETKRKVDRLRHDLGTQLDIDRVEHLDRMDDAQHQIEIRRLQRRAALDALQANDERARMTRDLDYVTAQADRRRNVHHAARGEVEAKIRREIATLLAEMEIEQAVTAFKTGEFDKLAKYMLAKSGYEEQWGEKKTVPEQPLNTGDIKLAMLEELLTRARGEGASAETQLRLRDEIDAVMRENEAAKARDHIP